MDFSPLLTLPAKAARYFQAGVYWHSNVTFSNLTTQELLKHAEGMMREDQEYLKDFNAAAGDFRKDRQSSRLNIRLSGGQACLREAASLSIHRKDERAVPRLCGRSCQAAGVRRSGRAGQHAVADDCGGEGQGQDREIVSLTVRNHYPALVPLGTLDSGTASTGVMPSA